MSLEVCGFDAAIRSHARYRARQQAFVEPGRSLTWFEFDAAVESVARVLNNEGVQRGDRVALLTGSSIWAYEAMFGTTRSGAVFTPLSALLPSSTLARLITDSGAKLILVSSEYEQVALELTTLVEHPIRLITEEKIRASTLRIEAPHYEPALDDLFTVVYSSGTTGVPKGILHTHGSRLGLAWQFGTALAVTPRARSLLTTPPSSNGTMLLLLPTVYAGGTCILSHTFNADTFYESIDSQSPTHAFLVPTQWRLVLNDVRSESGCLSAMRCLFSAGAPLAADLKSRLVRDARECFHEVWGFSEGVATVLCPGEAACHPNSVGRAMPGTLIKLIDVQGKEIHTGTGEIIGRSTMMMQGYLNRADADREIRWFAPDGTLYYRTGDLGEIDADGFLTLRGRIKDMIISGGLNVYPIDLETALLEHQDIEDAAVIGVPDDHWGEVPVAFVLPKPSRAVDPGSLKSWFNARVGKHQRLCDLIVMNGDFPRTSLGKVSKQNLREQYRAIAQGSRRRT